MAQVTKQPANADNYINQGGPTINYGTGTLIQVEAYSGSVNRSLLKFDFSADIAAGSTIDGATLSLYKYLDNGGSSVGRIYEINRLTQIAWVEAQSTWNIYSTGNNWATAGGDYTITNQATSVVPANNNWQNWTVKTQTQYALDSVSGIAHFLAKDQSEGSAGIRYSYYRSSNYVTDLTLRPKLVIDYTAGGAGGSGLIFFENN